MPPIYGSTTTSLQVPNGGNHLSIAVCDLLRTIQVMSVQATVPRSAISTGLRDLGQLRIRCAPYVNYSHETEYDISMLVNLELKILHTL